MTVPGDLVDEAVVVLDAGPRQYDAFPVLVGPFGRPVQVVDAAPEALAVARAGLPEGPATAEAVAVRLRRAGLRLRTVERTPAVRLGLRRERERGRAAVEVWRADPGLLPEVQLGSWASARWTARALRRALLPVAGLLPARTAALPEPALRLLADAAFWGGARRATSRQEWRTLTTTYVAYCYHRVAGEHRPGQERLDLSPARLAAHVRVLRLLGYRPLRPQELLDLHLLQRPPARRRRRYVLTLDDGFTDALDAAERHLDTLPHLYVPTSGLGRPADWAHGSPTATWNRVRALAEAGSPVGGHGRTHLPLDGLAADVLADEVAGSFADLHAELEGPLPVLAYPNGRHDLAARDAARAAGYRLAWTTDVGRNGAGTDPYCLRRIGLAEYDSLPSFVYQTLTGELLPAAWERRLLRRYERRTGLPAKAT